MEYYYRSHNEKVDPQVDPPLFDPLPRYGPTNKTSKPRKALRVILASILTYLFMRFVVSDVSSLIKNRHVQHREFRLGVRMQSNQINLTQSRRIGTLRTISTRISPSPKITTCQSKNVFPGLDQSNTVPGNSIPQASSPSLSPPSLKSSLSYPEVHSLQV